MTHEEFKALPHEQRAGVTRVHQRQCPQLGWEEFLERCSAPTGNIVPYVGIQINGMLIGVEPDGYSHT